jgi:hypothetical protein
MLYHITQDPHPLEQARLSYTTRPAVQGPVAKEARDIIEGPGFEKGPICEAA